MREGGGGKNGHFQCIALNNIWSSELVSPLLRSEPCCLALIKSPSLNPLHQLPSMCFAHMANWKSLLSFFLCSQTCFVFRFPGTEWNAILKASKHFFCFLLKGVGFQVKTLFWHFCFSKKLNIYALAFQNWMHGSRNITENCSVHVWPLVGAVVIDIFWKWVKGGPTAHIHREQNNKHIHSEVQIFVQTFDQGRLLLTCKSSALGLFTMLFSVTLNSTVFVTDPKNATKNVTFSLDNVA